MRKVLALLLLALLTPGTQAQTRSVEVERWDTVITDINPMRNFFRVEETLVLHTEAISEEEAVFTFGDMEAYEEIVYRLVLPPNPDSRRAAWQDEPK